MKTIGVIPARFQSTRFPGKPLTLIAGIPMIQRVYEQAKKVSNLDEVIVATDDKRIFDLVKSFGGQVQMTKESHRNGTERCAEVALSKPEVDLIVNIQGDEPFIAPEQIELLISQLKKQEKGIATLAKIIDDEEDWQNPNIVKVLFDANNNALYFSRAPLPFHRATNNNRWDSKQQYYKHIGLYAYHRKSLLEVTKLAASTFELAESLEQLRWLENGHMIGVSVTNHESIAVDTPQDVEKAENWFRKKLD